MPSYLDFEQIQANVFYGSRLGLLSDIKDLYADAIVQNGNQYYGVKIYSTLETTLFSRSKLFATYGVSVPIKEDVKWMTATQIGASNIFFGASTATAGGSAWGFDGSISSGIKYKKVFLGAALHQMTSSTLRPIGYTFKLGTYPEILATGSSKIGEDFMLEAGIKGRIFEGEYFISIDSKLTYFESVSALVALQDLKSASIGLELAIPADWEKPPYVFAAYRLGNSTDPFNVPLMSFGVRI